MGDEIDIVVLQSQKTIHQVNMFVLSQDLATHILDNVGILEHVKMFAFIDFTTKVWYLSLLAHDQQYMSVCGRARVELN